MAVSWELLLGGVSSMVDTVALFGNRGRCTNVAKHIVHPVYLNYSAFLKIPQDYFLDKMYILKLTINRYDSWNSVANDPLRPTCS